MKHDTRRYRDEHVSNERIFFFSIIRSAVTTEIDGAKDRRKEEGKGITRRIPPFKFETFVQVGTGRNETPRFPSTTVVC